MKLFSRRTDNGIHNSRQVAKCPANLVHGIAGTKSSARYDSPVTDFKSHSDMPGILAEGHCLRASRSTLISSGRERNERY